MKSREFADRFLGMLFLVIGFVPVIGYTQKDMRKCFKLPMQLTEVSGMYIESDEHWWWHNDSGDQPILYRTNSEGNQLKEVVLTGARNVDWEDMTHDDNGNIYIGDFGNNTNRRKDLRIYIYNSFKETLDSIEYSYPDQTLFPPKEADRNFDMEAFFWMNDSLHLFSKNKMGKGNYYCKHYIIPSNPGIYEAQLVDSIYLKNRIVTAAAISPDQKTVALLSYNYKKVLGIFPWSGASIFFIRDFENNHFFKGNVYKKKVPGFLLAAQFESLDFLNDDIIYVASEKIKLFKQKAKRVKIRARYFKDRKRLKTKK